ncbi:protocatechuate 3,4-dioxygenase subunit alpha [Paracoccus sp. S1E-3]|uniref:protocatechuate 3,4-dioxygenase subunit alpha n=1 Tax=Paracoccus sp. S1E-3 TaxID=2756130 RepID=UPI0015EEB3C4|nr:protocatechuate 3,4-dioxygenase subunit alpha [Paracoccus sp. S1E-3]MBA4490696.1 protocatechuate 3,4-dioxygenase subunit alpha [Paracoccus sp. S1E-3]
MKQRLDYLKESPSQTAGPFVHIGLAPGAAGFDIYRAELGHDIAGPNAKGQRIRVEGVVIDGTGSPVKDVLLEIWQANADGFYAHPEGGGPVEDGFRGWGRVITDFETGEWGFETVKPGQVAARMKLASDVSDRVSTAPDRQGRTERHAPMAPHINLWLVARGINIGLNTRMYFEDEAAANALDPVLNLIEWENRRATLIAKRAGDRDGRPVYRFEIRLQGDRETVFFDV